MRILFDQGTPVNLKPHLQGHTIKTAYQQGWSTDGWPAQKLEGAPPWPLLLGWGSPLTLS